MSNQCKGFAIKNRWEYLFIGVLGGILGSGLLILVFSPSRGVPVTLKPAPTLPAMVVHVAGAVAQPGVYILQPGSRVADAIEAAGGLLADANSLRLNMASFLEDGMLISVAFIPTPQPTVSIGSVPIEPTQTPTFPININTASLEELEFLPNIGSVKAQNIIDYREQHGPFATIEEIMNVAGIGPGIFDNIKDKIIVD